VIIRREKNGAETVLEKSQPKASEPKGGGIRVMKVGCVLGVFVNSELRKGAAASLAVQNKWKGIKGVVYNPERGVSWGSGKKRGLFLLDRSGCL